MAKKNLKYSAEKIDELLTKADEQMATKSDLTKKVDKVDGKGLSTNDYSTAEKNKLADIQEGAQRNTVTSVRGALQLNPQVGNVVISAADIGLGDAGKRLTALENNKLDKSEKGATNGVASLDENGRVPSSQLPSYVDDVIDDLNFAQFPATGESGKIYIAKDTNKTYRWSGNGYAEVSASLALGETEQTAYSGAKGKKNAEDIAKLADDLDETHQLASNAESAISEVVELTIPAIESELENKLGKNEQAVDSAKLGGVAADGYTRVLKGKTNTVNNHLYIGTLPASSSTTFDSLSIRGTIGGFGVIRRDFVDIAIGRRDGLQFRGLASFRYTGTSSYWDIAVNDAGEVYVLLYSQYCAYHIEVSSQQVTIEGVHNRTPTDTNWRYLREELASFDRFKADLFQTSPTSTSQPTRFAQLSASGLNLFGAATSGWANGMSCYDAESNIVGTVAGAYGEMSYTPKFFYYGGTYDRPIIKAYIGGAVEMKSTLTTKGNITAPKFIGALQGNADSATKLATPRTIWGQIFDGSGDINGDMTVNRIANSAGLRVIRPNVSTSIEGGNPIAAAFLVWNTNPYGLTIRCSGSTGAVSLQARREGNETEKYPLLLNPEGGNVGVGTTSPSEKLDVAGNIKATKFIGALQGNADSATKLATPRTIWGQSFDGSGNVDGDMEVNGDVVIKGNVVIEGNITSGASYQSNPLSTISEGEVPSVEQQLRSQISSLEERIATLERLIAQNNG